MTGLILPILIRQQRNITAKNKEAGHLGKQNQISLKKAAYSAKRHHPANLNCGCMALYHNNRCHVHTDSAQNQYRF